MSPRFRCAVALAFFVLPLAACGSVHAGQALPDQAAAGAYVTAKYSKLVGQLKHSVDVAATGIKVTEASRVVIDGKPFFDVTDTSVQTPKPIARAMQNRSNLNLDATFDTVTPANSKWTYIHLGRAYQSLARKPWAKLPRDASASGDSKTPGFQSFCTSDAGISTCNTLTLFIAAVRHEDGATLTTASSANGTKLNARLTFQSLIKQHVLDLPDEAIRSLPESTRQLPVSASIALDENGRLTTMSFRGNLSYQGAHLHKVTISKRFSFAPPSDAVVPSAPSGSQVVTLKTSKQIEKFYAAKSKIDQG